MEIDTGDTENPDSENEFAFETDHLALRGNKAYCDLLKFIVKLEAQKVQALKDIEDLAEAKNKALADPLTFVQNLKSGKVNFPPRQIISDPPHIEWQKYGIDIELETEEMKDLKPIHDDLEPKVRGRKYNDSKPETFNQLWSIEEQKRLEELLEIYPEEPVEAWRYKKIAAALGTRTPVQVMSRIQKYFAKLAKAGLPIPGRAPKRVAKDRSKSIFYKKTTFFPQLHVPIKMEDQSDNSETLERIPTTDTVGTSKYIVELLKAAKEQRLLDEMAPIYQKNTICVGCHKSGFLGARWTDNSGTDYCTDCVVKLLPGEKLIPVR